MPLKKANKTAKRPAKASVKKSPAKASAPRKTARHSTKLHPKPLSPKVAVKSTKPAAKTVSVKPISPKPVGVKPAASAAAARPEPIKEAAEKSGPIKFDIRPMVVTQPPPVNEEDGEFEPSTPASLLAGPRNVKPYIARRGEQYMNKEQLEHFGRILQNWKRDLMVEVDRTVLHMKDEAANFPDPNDRATQEEEFSLELRTRDRERKLIRKIDEALKRIEDGSYGYCLETGEEIGIKRLEARPVATLSVEAQERRERREKQYGDRDDRYR